MRKTAAAVTVGIMLIAGQAAATSNTVGARVSDRIGGQDGVVEEGLISPTFNPFILGALAAVVVAVGVVASDDGGAS